MSTKAVLHLEPAFEVSFLAAESERSSKSLKCSKSICELLQEMAARTPSAIALRDGAQTWSYGELAERTARLASYLRQAGVVRETLVGVVMDRSVHMLWAVLAILKAGGSYVPMDPGLPKERVAMMAEDGGVRFYITEQSLLEGLPSVPGAVIVAVDRDEVAISGSPPLAADALPRPEDRAYVLYTSGSTGKPKGVQITHGSLANLLPALGKVTGIRARDVAVANASLSFDASVTELFLPLSVGAAVVVARQSELQDTERFLELVTRSGCTYLATTPSRMRMLLRHGWTGSPDLTLSSVGEPLPKDLADQLVTRAKAVWNLYGPTEATVFATYWKVNPASSTVLIGTPLDGYAVKVVGDDGKPVPRGELGEICIGGVGVGRGYLNRPELTRDRFVDGYYKTGDMGRMRHNGDLEFHGRRDDQVKVRGYRVELGEIETTSRAHPSIADAVVVKGEGTDGSDKLTLYFVAKPSERSKADESFAQIWDDLYRHEGKREETIRLGESDVHTGYRDSATGKPMPAGEIREQIDTTVARIMALGPKKVYEIGCGVGLLALPLSEACERYVGADIAGGGVEVLRSELARQARTSDVHVADANDFRHMPDGEFDVIVLNSVIQYFPDPHYVISVLKQALAKLPDGGALFIGDVRAANLLELFVSDVILARAAARGGHALSPDELESRVKAALQDEEELLFSPEFFHALARAVPGVDRVRVELRRGSYDNEFNRYRYDVTLHVRSGARYRDGQPILDYARDCASLDAVEQLLSKRGVDAFVVSGVPNARLSDRKGERLAQHPDRFRVLAAKHAWHVSIPWSASGRPGDYDVAFTRTSGSSSLVDSSDRPDRYGVLKAPEAYVRARRDVAQEARLAGELRVWLGQRLPEYMVPSQFIGMGALPLNPSGKIDKGALPAAESARPDLHVPHVAPRNAIERRMVAILEEQLGVRPIGIMDGFFDVGGNSMTALSVCRRLEQEFNQRLSVIDFLKEGTIDSVSRFFQGNHSSKPDVPPAIVVVNEKGDKSPFFCVHGAGGLAYPLMDLAHQLGTDRPIYLMQDLANTGKQEPAETLEDLATHYIDAVKKVQPRGPYYLGGYSFGGVVAFEMAQQLRAAGDDVAVVMMLDSPKPRDFREGYEGKQRALRQFKGTVQTLTAFVPYLMDEAFLAMTTQRADRQQEGKMKVGVAARIDDAIYDWVKTHSTLAQILPVDSILLSRRHPEVAKVSQIAQHHERIWRVYAPKPYAGRVVCVMGAIRTVFTDHYQDDVLGWSPYFAGPVEKRFVEDGNHLLMPRRPHVLRLAEHVRHVLASV